MKGRGLASEISLYLFILEISAFVLNYCHNYDKLLKGATERKER
jgi:hypothetical protein